VSETRGRELRVGAVVLTALVVLAVSIFLIGEQGRLFTKKNRYFIEVLTVSGLHQGNPVELNGVTVGQVDRIVLPEDVRRERLVVWVSVDERFADRIREDSHARIRTLGLLGDKFIDLTSGSPETAPIPPGGQIPTAPVTDVDRLLTTGEDLVDNMVAISHSLRSVLARVDRGEGLLGELTTDDVVGKRITDSLHSTLGSIESVASRIDRGEGTLGRLVNDPELGDRLRASVDRFEGLLVELQEGEGVLPHLLHDRELRDQVTSAAAELQATSRQLQRWTRELEDADGLLPRLLHDQEYADRVTVELEGLVGNLAEVSEKLSRGEGTAARLINDPEVYEAVQDILVGVEESRLLRWLIRNRQQAGIAKRYSDTVEGLQATEETAGEASTSDDEEPGGPPPFPDP
jgi:phospholipid/cholesterol/gamma-HCH transport system substrate-binding protein